MPQSPETIGHAASARVTVPPDGAPRASWWSRLSLRWRLVLIATVPQLLYTNTMTWLGHHTVTEAHARLSAELSAYPAAVAALREIWSGDEIAFFMAISLGLGLVSAVGASRFARVIRKRIEHLRIAADRIAGGDLGTPVGLVGKSEIGRLGETLEEVRGTLTKRIELEVQAAVLEKDLALARTVEQLFLPHRDDFALQHACAAGFHRAALRVSGDFWQVHEEDEGSAWVLVGDVTGSGPGPAMIAGAVITSYRVLVKRKKLLEPEQLLHTMHASLLSSAAQRHTVAVALVRLTPEGTVTFYSAGSQPLLVRRGSGRVESVSGGGAALGHGKPAIAVRELRLAVGDLLMLHTGGLLDSPLTHGKGMGALRDRMLGVGRVDARRARDALSAELAELDTKLLNEDLTFVMISRAGETP